MDSEIETGESSALPSGWTNFFSELSSFLSSCERRYGAANERFTEYAMERLAQSFQSVSLLKEITQRSDGLIAVHGHLAELLEIIESHWHQWRNYSDILERQLNMCHYVPFLETSKHGRPKFHISKDQLLHLRSLSFSWTAIADLLMVSRMTIYRRRVEYGLLHEPHSSITNSELTEIIRQILSQHPQVGQTFVCGRLRSLGYKVARERVRHAVRSIDPLSAALRWQGITAQRRPYSVPGPNSLWHIGMLPLLFVLLWLYCTAFSHEILYSAHQQI